MDVVCAPWKGRGTSLVSIVDLVEPASCAPPGRIVWYRRSPVVFTTG
jgi:hypothetical protein